jgi:hypothetical protein
MYHKFEVYNIQNILYTVNFIFMITFLIKGIFFNKEKSKGILLIVGLHLTIPSICYSKCLVFCKFEAPGWTHISEKIV